jgi:hypothetical protein
MLDDPQPLLVNNIPQMALGKEMKKYKSGNLWPASEASRILKKQSVTTQSDLSTR